MVAGPEFGWGVYIDNINPVYAKPVTLTGVNTFNGNWNSGLEIWSSGTVKLSNLNANLNGTYYVDTSSYTIDPDTYVGCGDQFIDPGASDFYVGCGAYIDNYTYAVASTPQGVTLTGVNNFENNTHTGLIVNSEGQISLSRITANNNGWYDSDNDPDDGTVSGGGAYLYSDLKGVTLTGTNTFDNNWDTGLGVDTLGAITISNLEANSNGGDGAYLVNQYDGVHANITITGFATTEDNGSDGLSAFTHGSVSLINVNANWNGGSGALISAFDTEFFPANVSILGTNNFNGNGSSGSWDGLNVLSNGAITLNNITANWNTGTGAFLDNGSAGYWTPLPAVKIKLTGINTFNDNDGDGLNFLTYGNVTMTKIIADLNGDDGVYGEATGAITVTCGSMTNNDGYGYYLDADGMITFKGVYAFGNVSENYASPSPIIVRACP